MPAKTISTLHRTLEMLKVVPVYPRFILSKDVCMHLESIDAGVSKRTVERDLMALTDIVGLTFGESPEGYKWSFAYDSKHQFIPALSPDEALSLKLVQKHLKLFLPSASFEKLNALFAKSDDVLENHANASEWPSLVQAMPASLSPTPSHVDQAMIDKVYEALMQKRWLVIEYGDKSKQYKIKPVGVVIRDKKLVLVALYDGFDEARSLLVHRIKYLEMSSDKFTTTFDMEKYVRDQIAAVLLSDNKINLQFHAKGYVKKLLQESTLDASQVLTDIDETWTKVTLTLPHTIELENWLLTQLQNIKLIGPAYIKQRVLKKAHAGIALNQEAE